MSTTIHPSPEPPLPLRVAELQPVLYDLFHDTAEQLARATGFCQRARKLTGPVFAQTLVFSLLENQSATLDDFADAAADQLDTPVTPQAFDQGRVSSRKTNPSTLDRLREHDPDFDQILETAQEVA